MVIPRFDTEVPLRYPLLNPLSKGEDPSLRSLVSFCSPLSLRLGFALVATLGFKMGILEEKPQDLKELFDGSIVTGKSQSSSFTQSLTKKDREKFERGGRSGRWNKAAIDPLSGKTRPFRAETLSRLSGVSGV
jgi:hypothetical protein